MGLSNLFYRNPRLLALTLILILTSGFASLTLLPRAEDPELTARNSQIFTAFPGASAERVEALVTDVIEDMLAEFEEIKVIKSTSRAGISTVLVELHDAVADVDEVWSRIRDDLGDVRSRLPDGAQEPDFIEFELAAYTLMVGLTWDLDSEPERAILGRLAEDLADALRAVAGTHDVALHGAPREEVLVEVDPGRLAALGLDAGAVSAAIARSDATVAAGEVYGDHNDLQLEVTGEIDSLQRLREIVVDHDARGGSFVRVGDIATVTKTERTPRSSIALIDGVPGIVVSARMETGRRVDTWANDAREVANGVIADLPHGIRGEILFDQSHYTKTRLANLVFNFLVGAGLVMVVIFFTMGWRSALIVGTALPLTTLMVLQGLRTLGVPLHQMSITGMIIALGLLSDNAIVVVAEVRHRLQSGETRADAVSHAVRHLAVPLLGSTLTTCLAFAPIALMPGGAGEFVGPIAISVILAIASSLFLALTLTPALAGLLDRLAPARGRVGFAQRGLYSPALDRAYTRALGFLYRRPALGIGVAIVAPIVGFLAAPRLPEQFFPPADRDQFNVQFYLDPTASIDATEAMARRAREIALAHPRVERVHLFVGQSGPKYYYNLVETQRDAAYYAQAMIQLDGSHDSVDVIREVQAALDAELVGTVVLAQQIEQGPPFDAPIELHLFGPDLSKLREIGEQYRLILTEMPAITHVRSTLDGGAPKLRLRLDDEAARLAGIDNVGIAGALQLSLDGAPGGSLIEATEELPVRVRLQAEARRDVERIGTLEIPTATGWTNLASLGSLELIPETAAIAHRNRRRVVTTQGFVQAGVLPSQVVAHFVSALDSSGSELPRGYERELGGEAAKRDEAVGNLAGSAALLLVLMAASLVLTFNSFRLAAIVGVVGLLSIGLAILAVALYGAPLGFMTIVGAMGLIGIAINDSIVVLAALRESSGARAGSVDATVAVVRRASRHVLSTSLTTMAGFAPLIIAGGGFWPPLAVAIAGGVAGATVIAVTLVPTAHLLVSRQIVRRDAARETRRAARLHSLAQVAPLATTQTTTQVTPLEGGA